jgi:hypothetical protein
MKRIEDRPDCLFWLFDLNVPLLYGEGRKAFFKLEEELVKCSTTISYLLGE